LSVAVSRSAIAEASAADHVDLALRRQQRRPRPLAGGDRLLVVRVRLLEALHRGGGGGGELAIAHLIVPGAVDLRIGGGDAGLGLGDHRVLQAPDRVEIGERRLLAGDGGHRLRQRGAIVAVVELHQEIAGTDGLVVGDHDLGDQPGDLRRDDGDIAADIGIVGALDEAAHGPPMVAVPGDAEGDEKRQCRVGVLATQKPAPSFDRDHIGGAIDIDAAHDGLRSSARVSTSTGAER
jgi:hypothetical protein